MKNAALLLFAAILLWTCANQTTPDGGPKDEQPPVLLSSIPKNNGLNFRGKAILLEFSEPIRLKNPKEQIIIVPSTGKKTQYEVNRNTLTIKPELPWLENTTYSIQLREGVEDITEGNAAKNVFIAFSTGDVIDSLTISGSISETFSEKPPDDITVALYTSDTFDIQKHTPTFFTKADKNGRYRVQNLKPDRYYVYAFHDKNKNLKSESKTERLGFLVTPIDLKKDTTGVNLQITLVDARPLKVISVRRNGLVNRIRLNKPIANYRLTGHAYLHAFGDNQSEIAVYFPEIKSDSSQIAFTAIDSVNNQIDTVLWLATRNQTITESFKLTIQQASLNLETNQLEFSGTYTKPIAKAFSDSIYIRVDSATTTPLNPQALRFDSIQKNFAYAGAFKIPDSAEVTNKWQLIFAATSLISVSGDTLKRITKAMTFLDQQSTGTLLIDPIKTSAKSYIIQVLDSQGNIVREYLNPTKLTIPYLPPESFRIRAVIDANRNGRWDAGNIYQKRAHERTVYFRTSEGKYETPVRANWEVGPLRFTF